MKIQHIAAAIGLTLALVASGCSKKKEESKSQTPTPQAPAAQLDPAALSAFGALPAAFPADGKPDGEAVVALGRMLYYDTRLSKNQELSCNSCHQLDHYGVDNAATSTGHKGQKGSRNSPTVYNAAGHLAQFWDGRAADVEAQAKGPVLNPAEMAMPDEHAVVAVLESVPGYRDAFAAAFPGDDDPITYDNMAAAIGAFERRLVTPSRWDQAAAGNIAVLTAEEQKGFQTFVDTGCPTCHTGPLFGGQMYQKAGLVEAWPNQTDLGRFDVTKSDADRMIFKVPSLRNVDKTGPYFHDGSVTDLSQAVRMMARYQLGKQLDDGQVKALVAFLDSLTGELPKGYIEAPALPPSGPETPGPDPT